MSERNIEKEYEYYTKLKEINIYKNFITLLIINNIVFIIILSIAKFISNGDYNFDIFLSCVFMIPLNLMITAIIGLIRKSYFIKNKESLINNFSKVDLLINDAASNYNHYEKVNKIEKELTLDEIKNINKFMKEYDYNKVVRNQVASFEEYKNFNEAKKKVESEKVVVLSM